LPERCPDAVQGIAQGFGVGQGSRIRRCRHGVFGNGRFVAGAGRREGLSLRGLAQRRPSVTAQRHSLAPIGALSPFWRGRAGKGRRVRYPRPLGGRGWRASAGRGRCSLRSKATVAFFSLSLDAIALGVGAAVRPPPAKTV
jgi:hypothetical protein